MAKPRVPVVVAVLALSLSAFPTAVVATPPDNVADRLFSILPGNWDGRAIETPVGPVDYAITFHRCDTGATAGVAELNVSDHHWRFWRLDGETRLTFLSTFRGNQSPTQLLVSKTEDDTLWFFAPDPALLTLSVTLTEPKIDIRVFHHAQPHVHIRLTRSERQGTETKHGGDKEKSCKMW